jgi:hypothetical protein
MRKLLLASAAAFGATLGLASGAKAQPVKPVAAGTLVVHLNGYLQFEIGNYGSTFNNYKGYKLNSVTTDGDVRLYPGFDAMTANGIDYGAQVETRVTTSNGGKAVGSNSASTSGTGSVYVRRAFGQADSVFGLLQTGVLEAFGDGGQFNEDGGIDSVLPTNAVPGQFIYADQGALYATDKVVYLTPAIAGFSGGFGYEPNSNGLKQGYATNATASATSAALSASPLYTDITGTKRQNTVDVAVQYMLKANGFLVKTSAGYLHGATTSLNGVAGAIGNSAHYPHYGYDDLSVYQVGGQVTYAGFTLAGNIKGGQVEDGYAFKPKGARDALSFILGANYVVGPYVIGASYFNGQTSGAYLPGVKGTARTLSEYGAAVGANYVLSPNASFFLQYLYGHRHQPGNSVLSASGNAQVQAIAAGATLKW